MTEQDLSITSGHIHTWLEEAAAQDMAACASLAQVQAILMSAVGTVRGSRGTPLHSNREMLATLAANW